MRLLFSEGVNCFVKDHRTQAGRFSGRRGKREKHAKVNMRDETRQASDNDLDYDTSPCDLNLPCDRS